MPDPTCVYCNNSMGSTRDHVPPRSFFPHPRPSDLITVSACLRCNQSYEVDEEFFIATFMFGDAGVSDAGRALWNERLHRMYERNRGLRRRIAENLQPVEIRTPSGLYVREGYAIPLEEPRLLRVIEKIIRGLYFFEFDDSLPIDLNLLSHFARSHDDMAAIVPVAHQLRFGTRRWEGIFEYRFNRVEERPAASIWVLRLYSCNVFWGITNTPEATALLDA